MQNQSGLVQRRLAVRVRPPELDVGQHDASTDAPFADGPQFGGCFQFTEAQQLDAGRAWPRAGEVENAVAG